MNKENEESKGRVIRDIRKLFQKEKEDYWKLVGVENFWSRNYIEYESNRNRNKTLSIDFISSKDTMNKV